MTYADYIAGPEWKATRNRIVRQRGALCERCGSDKYLNVHHLTYDRLGHERDDDLLLLCEWCHCDEHGIEYLGHPQVRTLYPNRGMSTIQKLAPRGVMAIRAVVGK